LPTLLGVHNCFKGVGSRYPSLESNFFKGVGGYQAYFEFIIILKGLAVAKLTLELQFLQKASQIYLGF
jgi:hypothetical protein